MKTSSLHSARSHFSTEEKPQPPLYDELPIFVWSTDANGNWNYLSQSWLDFTHHYEMEHDKSAWIRSLHLNDRDKFKSIFEKNFLQRKEFSCEARLKKFDDQFIWLLIKGKPKFSENVFQGFVGIGINISEQKNKENNLSSLANQYYDFFENAPVGLRLVDKDGIILRANQAELDLFGLEPSEYIGKPLAKFFVNDEVAADLLAKQRRGEVLTNFEAKMRRKDGSVFDALLSTNVLWRNGEFIHSRCFTRDISDRKRMAELLHQSHEDLEQFSFVASHDLKEPLRTIALYLNLLERHIGNQLDDTSKEYIRFSVDAAKRMRSLIDALLRYAIAGKRRLELKTQDCNIIVDRALENLRREIEKTGAEIKVDELPFIPMDEILMVQVFQNLIGNAIKFHRENAPQIHVGVKTLPYDWVFYVKDKGIGFEMKYASHIFNAFKRLHTGDEFQGSGIGLALSKKIIERHHGKLWAESKPGEGSIFYFSIPRS